MWLHPLVLGNKNTTEYESTWSEGLILSWHYLHLDLNKSVYLFLHTSVQVLNAEYMDTKQTLVCLDYIFKNYGV